MFKRGGAVTRSLHAPHGVNITALDNNPRMKRKLSWSSPKVRSAASEGVLTHKPVLLKEGFLYKPGFLKITGRKRRWCVLRTYSPSEASIDIYMDDTKSRFKGTISLDKDLCPMLIVKNYDAKKKSPKNVYLSLKIGKRTYQFTTDSFRELKEWSALLRQAIDNGLLFSGKITEPLNIEDGMVNVKFNSNCIAVICPIRETAIKTWRLNHITSFGQCGGMLTFECCSTCSDPGTSRCSVNIIQEKSTTVLNLMEKAIRSNPNTSEIHYERSILGDIYHCDHDCCQPQRLLPAYSDPNIYRSTSASPQKECTVPVDIHEFEVRNSTISSGKSSDSGFPDTPLPPGGGGQREVSSTPSPTPLGIKPRHAKINIPSPNMHMPVHHGRSTSYSETASLPEEDSLSAMPTTRRMTDPNMNVSGFNRLNYADFKASGSSPKRNTTIMDDSVHYATVQLTSPAHKKLDPVDENEGIYDTPFEPTYWEVPDGGTLSPLGVSNSQRSSRSDSSTGVPITVKVTTSPQHPSYVPGTDERDRNEDYADLPPVPKHRRPGRQHNVKEMVRIFNPENCNNNHHHHHHGHYSHVKGRSRLHSTGDVLETDQQHRSPRSSASRHRGPGSMSDLSQTGVGGIVAAQNDLLSKLHEQDELLTKFLARSRNERNDALGDMREEELVRPYRCFGGSGHDDFDCLSPSGRSSASSDRGVDRVLTKVASDTVRGYAYKIQIPLSDTVYDVPRRTAPAPDLSNVRSDAPPKPRRHTTTTES